MIARETRLARIDSPGVRLYKACFNFGPGAAKARRAFSFAHPSQHGCAVHSN
jgi:hypothetical protein